MFEDFTTMAQQAVSNAQKAALALGHGHIGTEHLLIGVLSTPLGTLYLEPFRVTKQSVEDALTGIIGSGTPSSVRADKLSPRCRVALDLARMVAQEHQSPHVNLAHLLFGILREDDGVAMALLRALGVDKAALETALLSHNTGQD